MKKSYKMLVIISVIAAFLIFSVFALGAGNKQSVFSPYVNSDGIISMPNDFRSSWSHLGTWLVTSKAQSDEGPGSGLHDVYTQPDSLKAYKQNGTWPEGTVLIKEVRALKWDDLPTGHVIYGNEVIDWFVMVRDTKDRFSKNPNWGDGWGWAHFKAAAPMKNISGNYTNDCMSCHDLAKDTEWVFVRGYPTLR